MAERAAAVGITMPTGALGMLLMDSGIDGMGQGAGLDSDARLRSAVRTFICDVLPPVPYLCRSLSQPSQAVAFYPSFLQVAVWLPLNMGT